MTKDDNIEIVNNELLQFIEKHNDCDPIKLKLKYSQKKFNFSLDFALLQISLRQRCSKKLPSFLKHTNFLFPDKLSSEQSTDEKVAQYHASLINPGSKIIDMTAGLGIDAMTIASKKINVTAIELNKNKAKLLYHNVVNLDLENYLTVVCADSIKYAGELSERFDTIFIDPARRDNDNKRTYSFSDCEPDVVSNFSLLLNLSDRILIKASPLLDITQIRRELPDIKNIHIIVKDGECKEVLVEVEKNSKFENVILIDIKKENEINRLSFSSDELINNSAPIIDESDLSEFKYLYEPNAGLMKLNCSGAVCEKYPGIMKVSPNTSLYVAKNLHKDFPGRIFENLKIIQKKDNGSLKNQKINIAVRNYPITAAELKKKLKTKEGTHDFLFGIRIGKKEKPQMVRCSRI